ncbi:YqgQ family protein [Anaerobacillus sp. MEB173]|uniref:YqgQ family protein n=1 Tax=Anaerobacillus sp. MEB173 TaxID=3383345 RepID=UPI003F9169BB
MQTFYDVQQLLKQFGTIIYTGDRTNDLILMEEEIRELFEWKMIDVQQFQKAILIIRNEANHPFKLT